jgi:hypothetical protein
METQVCSKCREVLPLARFQPLASGKGYYKKCTSCISASPVKIVDTSSLYGEDIPVAVKNGPELKNFDAAIEYFKEALPFASTERQHLNNTAMCLIGEICQLTNY